MPVIENRLWEFALALYEKPEVAACCLQLQDRNSVNVNILLWSIWLEHKHLCLTDERLLAACELIQQWDENYVQVLRTLRRNIKHEFKHNLALVANVRDSIKHAELTAEKQELQWLENIVADWRVENCQIKKGKNMEFYLEHMRVPVPVTEQVKIIFNRNKK